VNLPPKLLKCDRQPAGAWRPRATGSEVLGFTSGAIGTSGAKKTSEIARQVLLVPKDPLDDTLAGQLFQLGGVDPDL
jgi:hypothetical protein